MPPPLGFNDLRNRIDWVFRTAPETQCTPTDLKSVCRFLNISVEWRRMVPEGVTVSGEDGLHIYLQDNFLDNAASQRRQRFTWAHEICHALFYEETSRPPRPLAGTPKGAHLEKVCQRGAGYLLIPSGRLAEQFNRQRQVSSIDDVRTVTERYDVSSDVAVRRIHEDRVLKDGYAVLLLRDRSGGLRIDAAAHGAWLQTYFRTPRTSDLFDAWAEPFLRVAIQAADASWARDVEVGTLLLTRHTRSRTSEFVEIRLRMQHSL